MKYFTLLFLACILTACPVEDCDCVPPPGNEGNKVIISSELYKNGPTDHLTIIDAEIKDDSLHIEFGSSGCDGSSWVLALYDAGEIMESSPEQRNIRLSLKNEELCDAYFTKKIAFDIAPLKINSDKIYLNLKGWDNQLLYDY